MLPLLFCTVASATEAPAPAPTPNVAVPALPKKYKLGLPVGVPQFAFDRPVLGATHVTLQLGGIAGTVLATGAMLTADEEERYEDAVRWRFVSAGTTAVFALSYFTSVLMGSRDYQTRQFLIQSSASLSPDQRAEMAMSWQNRRAMADYL